MPSYLTKVSFLSFSRTFIFMNFGRSHHGYGVAKINLGVNMFYLTFIRDSQTLTVNSIFFPFFTKR